MYEKVEACPTCTSKEFKNHIICDDHTVSKESFAIVKCSNCGLMITNPRPDKASIGSYYQSENYISHTNEATNLVNTVYKLARKYTLNQKYRLIEALKTEHSLLDYGCGTGHFIDHLKSKEWKTEGVEPDPTARSIASENTGLVIHPSIAEIPKNKYGVISLWHVLEHVHDLNETIQSLRNLLHKEGRLVIAVPNHESYDQKIYKQHWAAYDTPRHLYHFNQLTIKELMKYKKLKLVETHPMKLDAYYVSMLSEQHKNGKNNYLNSIINGWKSNRWAKKHDNNYSSLIYIFKKA